MQHAKKERTEGGMREGRKRRKGGKEERFLYLAGSQRNELVTSLYPIRYIRVFKASG